MATITSPISSAPAAQSAPHRRRYRYADNVYLQDGFVVIGVLSILLFLVVAVSLDAATHVDNMTMLLPVTLGACTLGILMSFSRFDAFFALSHSLFTGLAWILYQMTPLVGESEIAGILDKGITPLQAKSYVVLVAWMDWIAAAVTQQANEDNFVFIFEIAFLVWWLTFLGVWAIFRYGYTWRAVIPAGIVLVINTYYAPQSTLGFLVLFSLVALVLLVRTNLSEQQLRWREQRTYFNPDISLDFMRNALIYSVIVLAIAWILPGLGRSPQVRTLMDPLVNEPMEEAMERVRVLYKGLYSSQTLGTAAFTQSLTLGGPRNPGNKPVFHVDTTDGRYWRAVTYDTYSDGRWNDVGSVRVEYAPGEVVPVMNWDYRRPVTHTVRLMSDTSGVIFALADIRQADVPLDSRVQSISGEGGGEGDEMVGPVEISIADSRKAMVAGDSYTTVSNHSEVTENALIAAGMDYPPAILERYLQLPEDFSPDVQNMAQEIAASQETVYEKVKSIETFLREIPYNDQIAAPPEGVEPVEYFLFDVQEGYCDYYATSMVVMLRSLGIPARAASGYAEGKRNEDGTILSEEDAHTWVEVFFPEYGWIEFEPTAEESALERPRGDEFEESGAIPGRPDEMPDDRGGGTDLSDGGYDPYLEDFSEDPFQFPDSAAVDSVAPWWVWAVVTPLALLLGFFLLTRTRFLGPTQFTTDPAPLVFERMHGWGKRLGLNLTHAQTPYEQAARVRRSFPEGQPYIDSITDSYVRYSFSQEATSESTVTEISSGRATTASIENVTVAWQQLRRLFWKAWLRKTFLPDWKRKQNPYTLSRR